jgi:hypothetical protein
MNVAVDEDQIDDDDPFHTPEQIDYIVFSEAGPVPRPVPRFSNWN